MFPGLFWCNSFGISYSLLVYWGWDLGFMFIYSATSLWTFSGTKTRKQKRPKCCFASQEIEIWLGASPSHKFFESLTDLKMMRKHVTHQVEEPPSQARICCPLSYKTKARSLFLTMRHLNVCCLFLWFCCDLQTCTSQGVHSSWDKMVIIHCDSMFLVQVLQVPRRAR